MKRALLMGLAVLLCTAPAMAADFQWSGTASGYYQQNLDACFDPNGIGTTISGTLDISSMDTGAVEMFGLIDKKLMDDGGYMWQSGAYMYVYKSASNVKIGTSDGNIGGEITTNASNVGNVSLIPFALTVQGGQISLTSSLFAGTKTSSYGAVKTYNNAYGYAWDEFEYGAYLGGSLWPASTFAFDVTATNATLCPIPEPVFFQMGALIGMSGLGMLRLRKRA